MKWTSNLLITPIGCENLSVREVCRLYTFSFAIDHKRSHLYYRRYHSPESKHQYRYYFSSKLEDFVFIEYSAV